MIYAICDMRRGDFFRLAPKKSGRSPKLDFDKAPKSNENIDINAVYIFIYSRQYDYKQ